MNMLFDRLINGLKYYCRCYYLYLYLPLNNMPDSIFYDVDLVSFIAILSPSIFISQYQALPLNMWGNLPKPVYGWLDGSTNDLWLTYLKIDSASRQPPVFRLKGTTITTKEEDGSIVQCVYDGNDSTSWVGLSVSTRSTQNFLLSRSTAPLL